MWKTKRVNFFWNTVYIQLSSIRIYCSHQFHHLLRFRFHQHYDLKVQKTSQNNLILLYVVLCTFISRLVFRHLYGPIFHRFWDTATYWLKIAYFSYPSLIRRSRSLCSLWNFAVKLSVRKLVMGLSSSEDPMIVAWVVLTQCQRVTDRWTDGQTDLL